LAYPPFGRLISIYLRGEDRGKVLAAGAQLKACMTTRLTRSTILGPAPPPIERLEGRFRRRLLIKTAVRLDAVAKRDKEVLMECIRDLNVRHSRDRISVSVDVDPVGV
jgi:primosomal protein N' (replication factor Y)